MRSEPVRNPVCTTLFFNTGFQKFRPLRAELVIFHLSHAPAHHTHSARLAELMRSHPHDMTRAAHPSASLFSTWNAISLLKSSAL